MKKLAIIFLVFCVGLIFLWQFILSYEDIRHDLSWDSLEFEYGNVEGGLDSDTYRRSWSWRGAVVEHGGPPYEFMISVYLYDKERANDIARLTKLKLINNVTKEVVYEPSGELELKVEKYKYYKHGDGERYLAMFIIKDIDIEYEDTLLQLELVLEHEGTETVHNIELLFLKDERSRRDSVISV